MITAESIQNYFGPSLARGISFVYVSPHPLLSRFIANYTITCPSFGNMTDNYTILPTSSATIVYSIGCNTITGRLRGINTKAVVVGSHANLYDAILLIEFHPAGLYPIVKMQQSELLDDSFPFEHIDKQLNKDIIDAVLSTDRIESLKESLDHIFLLRLVNTVLNPQLVSTMRAIYNTHGSGNLNLLPKTVFLCERQLERLFTQQVGISIKTFSRIVRMNHSVRLLQTTNDSMSLIAVESGYHDQSHFIHDFQALCGTTPRIYLNKKSDFYNDAYKM